MNTSNSFITKQIWENAMLACSKCLLGRPRQCLTEARDAKGANGASARDAFLGVTSAEGASVGVTSPEGAFVWGACGDSELFIISWWLSIDVLSIK